MIDRASSENRMISAPGSRVWISAIECHGELELLECRRDRVDRATLVVDRPGVAGVGLHDVTGGRPEERHADVRAREVSDGEGRGLRTGPLDRPRSQKVG